MGCGSTKEVLVDVAPEDDRRNNKHDPAPRKQTPPPKDPTPPPREPTPPPKDPTPPPKDNNDNDDDDDDNIKRTYNLMGGPGYFDTHPEDKTDTDTDKNDPEPVPDQDNKQPTPQPTPPPQPPPPDTQPNDQNENQVKDDESQIMTHDEEWDYRVKQGEQGGEDQTNDGQDQVIGPPAPPPPPTDDDLPPTNDDHHDQSHDQSQDQSHVQQTDDDFGGRRSRDPQPDPDPAPAPVPPPIPADDHRRQEDDHNDHDHRDDHRHGGQGEKEGDSLQGYTKTQLGTYEKFYDLRDDKEPLDCDFAQTPSSLPFTDGQFGASQAIKGQTVEWKRPREFCPGAVLFTDGVTRFDVGQGGAGTCWFLSTVAMLADNPEFFHRAVPKDAWNPDGGYFYCFFWRYGEWERIVIDDYLPIVYDTNHWGAKSRDNVNEMWPALLEKAFARFHGNYNSVYGGQSGDAYLALTGGCSEYIDFDKEFEKNRDANAKRLHMRLKNAIKSKALVCTEVPSEYDNHHGLVGGHAYSLSGAMQVVDKSGRAVYLVRVRNPWGHTEWTGPWKDNGGEWDTLQPGQIQHDEKDDGEFWMELDHFIKYFSGVTICSLTPDFDKDGCEDTLNVCTNLFGQWKGKEAAGFQKRFDNPRYTFFIDDEGMDSDGLVPLVVQICQKLKHRKDDHKASIRVDLCQVLAEDADKGMYVLQLLGDVTNLYKKERQMSNRYKVEPGQYVVIPSTIDEDVEKDFLIRIFSPSGLRDVRKISSDASVTASEKFEPPEVQGVDNKMRFCETRVGSWKAGFNAGGQISQQSYHCNPQIEFEIPNRGPQMVNVTVMQSSKVQGNPVGCQLFEIDDGYEISRDRSHLNYLYDHHDNSPPSVDGDRGKFVLGASASTTHVLEPGRRYFCIFHMDAADAENDFSVVVRSTCSLDLKLHSF